MAWAEFLRPGPVPLSRGRARPCPARWIMHPPRSKTKRPGPDRGTLGPHPLVLFNALKFYERDVKRVGNSHSFILLPSDMVLTLYVQLGILSLMGLKKFTSTRRDPFRPLLSTGCYAPALKSTMLPVDYPFLLCKIYNSLQDSTYAA